MNRVCLALDFHDEDELRRVAEEAAPFVGLFKIGLTAFLACGPDVVRHVGKLGPVFLDLKLHDIPAQVGGAVAALADADVAYTTVHAAGGRAMVEAAVAAAGPSLKILGVTVLTSLDEPTLDDIGMTGSPEHAVLRLADVALRSGAHGIVCSPLEIEPIRQRYGSGPLVVVPGVRSGAEASDDQRRTATGAEAIARGADIVVVGRPITRAPSVAEAARRFLDELRA